MKKKYAAMILVLPALAVVTFIGAILCLGFEAGSIGEYLEGVLFLLVYHTIAGISAIVWLFLGVAGFTAGAWLLLTARSRVWLRLGAGLSMLPVIAVVLAFFFLEYRGP